MVFSMFLSGVPRTFHIIKKLLNKDIISCFICAHHYDLLRIFTFLVIWFKIYQCFVPCQHIYYDKDASVLLEASKSTGLYRPLPGIVFFLGRPLGR